MPPVGAVPRSLLRKAEGALSFPWGEGGGKEQKRKVPLIMLQETGPSVQNCKGGVFLVCKKKIIILIIIRFYNPEDFIYGPAMGMHKLSAFSIGA